MTEIVAIALTIIAGLLLWQLWKLFCLICKKIGEFFSRERPVSNTSKQKKDTVADLVEFAAITNAATKLTYGKTTKEQKRNALIGLGIAHQLKRTATS